MFTKDSMLVQLWVKWINKGEEYSREDVPKLSNLQEMVYAVLDAEEQVAQ